MCLKDDKYHDDVFNVVVASFTKQRADLRGESHLFRILRSYQLISPRLFEKKKRRNDLERAQGSRQITSDERCIIYLPRQLRRRPRSGHIHLVALSGIVFRRPWKFRLTITEIVSDESRQGRSRVPPAVANHCSRSQGKVKWFLTNLFLPNAIKSLV